MSEGEGRTRSLAVDKPEGDQASSHAQRCHSTVRDHTRVQRASRCNRIVWVWPEVGLKARQERHAMRVSDAVFGNERVVEFELHMFERPGAFGLEPEAHAEPFVRVLATSEVVTDPQGNLVEEPLFQTHPHAQVVVVWQDNIRHRQRPVICKARRSTGA